MPKRTRHWWGIDVNAWDAGLWTLVLLGVATVIGVGMLTPLLPFVLGLTVPMVAAAVGGPLLLYGLVSWRLNHLDRVGSQDHEGSPWSWSMWRAFRFGVVFMPLAWLAALYFLPWAWPVLLAATLAVPVGLWLGQALIFQWVWNRIAISDYSYPWMRQWAFVLGAEPAYQYDVGVGWDGIAHGGTKRMYEVLRSNRDFTTMFMLFGMGAHLEYTNDMIRWSGMNNRADMVRAFLGIKVQEAGGVLIRHAIERGVSDEVIRQVLEDKDTQPQSFDDWVWVFRASIAKGRDLALLKDIWRSLENHQDSTPALRQSTLDEALRVAVRFCCDAKKEAQRNDRSLIEYLVVQGANPAAYKLDDSRRPKGGSTAFQKAFGHANLVQYFIELGVLKQPGMRAAFLTYLAKKGDEDQFIQYVDDWGSVKPSHISHFERHGNTTIRARWLKAVKVTSDQLAACCAYALWREDLENFKYYLDTQKVSPNTVMNDTGNTLLMYVLRWWDSYTPYANPDLGKRFIEAILFCKPDLTQQNKKGETALHMAVVHLGDSEDDIVLLGSMLAASPEAVRIKDNAGTMPHALLHWRKPKMQKYFNAWLKQQRQQPAKSAANGGSVQKDGMFAGAGGADSAAAVVAAVDGP